MRLAVLGCGAVGSVVARLAVKTKVAESVVCLDRDVEKARSFLSLDEGGGVPVEEADAVRVDELAAKLKGFDFVVNSLPTFVRVGEREVLLNPLVMEAALRAGVGYVDLACYGGKRRRAEQLSLSKRFLAEGVTAVINAGASPGLSNILAREAYEDFDRAHSVKVMSLEDQRGSSFIISWSKEEMLNVATPVLVYRNGRYFMSEPFAESALCEFPEPIGSIRCYSVSNDESYTIPAFLRIRDFSYYAGGSDIETLRALYRLGVLEDRKILVRGRLVPLRSILYQVLREPSGPLEAIRAVEEGDLEDAFFALKVVVEGEVGGARAVSSRSVVFPSQRRVNELMPGATYITYPTALVALAVMRVLRGRRLAGVYPPEALPGVVRRGVLAELESHKVFVNEEFRVLV
ncbi:saccharopine dehydrogenase family protein [Infirmifilum sp. NZ]|uniref:saccharopine dehydrogenase family protein n=1 Tax=Infirmifilum sp. NZ TaxID=2926850 RepID=UPI0027A9EB93|nr:saccharopine dehydrogenase NADP-binding domain-containing protein [Infirmifilum sp. NZ]UNQ73668.1 saccharopine dehydrogenase NADP-binding domain-containing protein [Infirmifilum sp. NZ]